MTTFLAPRPITEQDDSSTFGCGEQTLDNWLRLRAIKNEAAGNSRTFITVERESGLIAGYYCLSAHSLHHEQAPGSLRRNSPNPIPVILIGRLAVDSRFKAMGVGSSLLKHAFAKGIEASRIVGSRAFLVDALNDEAVAFYEKWGFQLVPASSRVMYVLTADAMQTIADVASDL